MRTNEDGGPAFPRLGEGFGNPNYEHAGMTLRQYAAFKLRVPDSGTYWLDDMIRQANRNDFAAAALQGLCARDLMPNELQSLKYGSAEAAYAAQAGRLADAMLAESEKGDSKDEGQR